MDNRRSGPGRRPRPHVTIVETERLWFTAGVHTTSKVALAASNTIVVPPSITAVEIARLLLATGAPRRKTRTAGVPALVTSNAIVVTPAGSTIDILGLLLAARIAGQGASIADEATLTPGNAVIVLSSSISVGIAALLSPLGSIRKT